MARTFVHTILYLAAFLLVVFAVSAFVSAPGTIPNPGHALQEIQGYFQGDASLEDSLGKFCQSDGTNCKPPTGTVLGGGDLICEDGMGALRDCSCDNLWGVARCPPASPSTINCNEGTPRVSGHSNDASSPHDLTTYLCIAD